MGSYGSLILTSDLTTNAVVVGYTESFMYQLFSAKVPSLLENQNLVSWLAC